MFIAHLSYTDKESREPVRGRATVWRNVKFWYIIMENTLLYTEKAHGRLQVSNGRCMSVYLAMFDRADVVFHVSYNYSVIDIFNCFPSSLPNSQNASVVSGGGFMRGTKFRYSGRTEREILTENLNVLRQQHLANNTSPSKRKANSVPATPSSPQGDLAEIRKFR